MINECAISSFNDVYELLGGGGGGGGYYLYMT